MAQNLLCWATQKICRDFQNPHVIYATTRVNSFTLFLYFECLIKELGINNNTSSNTTYKPTSFDKDEILANHRSFITSLNIPSFKRVFNLSCGRVVYRVEKSKVLMEDTREKDLDLRLSLA
jgi:hypothetical protein